MKPTNFTIEPAPITFKSLTNLVFKTMAERLSASAELGSSASATQALLDEYQKVIQHMFLSKEIPAPTAVEFLAKAVQLTTVSSDQPGAVENPESCGIYMTDPDPDPEVSTEDTSPLKG